MWQRIVDFIAAHAAATPDSTAIMCPSADGGTERLSYAVFWDKIRQRAQEYLASGVRSGEPLAIRTTQDSEFLVSYFAAHLAGAVALPLDGDLPHEKFRLSSLMYKDFIAPEGTADILYTTGTTGRSKGVMISHEAILADAFNLIGAMGFDRDVWFIINGPLNHIGSLSKTYPVLLQGGTLHILEGMKDLSAFFAAVDSAPGQVATFLVPSAIRMLLGLAKKELTARRDKFSFIETGAAPLSQSDMEDLHKVLPYTRLYNTYASTETGIISTFEYSREGCIPGCLGLPMQNSSVFITSEGKIACQGRTLMSGYAGEPELTAAVLREGTVYTADNAYLDEKGRLRLTGRDDDVINIGGFKVAPVEVEDVALSHPSVEDCICICEQTPMGHILTLLVVQKEGTPLSGRALAMFMSERLERHKVPLRYREVASIKRTFNGKLDRKAYR